MYYITINNVERLHIEIYYYTKLNHNILNYLWNYNNDWRNNDIDACVVTVPVLTQNAYGYYSSVDQPHVY